MKKKTIIILLSSIFFLFSKANENIKEEIMFVTSSNPEVISLEMKLTNTDRVMVYNFQSVNVEPDTKMKVYYSIRLESKSFNNMFNTYCYDYKNKLLYAEKSDGSGEFEEIDYNLFIFADIQVDSCYSTYSHIPLTDSSVAIGFRNQSNKLKYNEVAWASSEKNTDHWVEFDFKKIMDINEVVIYWAEDKGKFYVSKEIQFSSEEIDGINQIKPLRIKNNLEMMSTHYYFSKLSAKKIRVIQPKGKGSTNRPNLMWIREICAY